MLTSSFPAEYARILHQGLMVTPWVIKALEGRKKSQSQHDEQRQQEATDSVDDMIILVSGASYPCTHSLAQSNYQSSCYYGHHLGQVQEEENLW